MKHFRFVALGSLCLLPFLFFAQGLSFQQQNPTSFDICGQASFKVRVSNNEGIALNNIRIGIKLPSGMSYIPQSGRGMVENNITNLNNPEFVLPALNVGQSIDISYEVFAGCELFDLVNQNLTFSNQYHYSFGSKTDSIYSQPPFELNTAYLVIESINDINTTTDMTVSRPISIKNTRIGACKSFRFFEKHSPMKVQTSQGTLLTKTDTTLLLQFGPVDFLQIGDKDSLFERDEVLILNEKLSSVDCNSNQVRSDYKVSWGCNNIACQENTVFANTTFINATQKADIQILTEPLAPICICDSLGEVQRFTVINSGKGTAENFCIIFEAHDKNVKGTTAFVRDSFRTSQASKIRSITFGPNESSCDYEHASREFKVCFEDILPGDTIVLYFRFFTCLGSVPSNPSARLFYLYSYNYNSKCVFPSSAGKMNVLAEFPYQKELQTDLQLLTPKNNFKPDEIVPYKVKLFTERKRTKEILFAQVIIPCVLELDSSSLQVSGASNYSLDLERNTFSTFLNYKFSPPFLDSVEINFLLKANCNSSCLEKIKSDGAYFNISSCRLQDTVKPSVLTGVCASSLLSCRDTFYHCGPRQSKELIHSVQCPNLKLNIDSIPGYVLFNSNSKRHSFGLNDLNEDRFQDGTTKDTSLFNALKLITGDTLYSLIKAEVIQDIASANLDSISIMFQTELSYSSGLIKLNIIKKKLGTVYETNINRFSLYSSNNPPVSCYIPVVPDVSYGNGIYFGITRDTLVKYGTQVPSDFKFEDGDSLIVEFYGRVSSVSAGRISQADQILRIMIFDRNKLTPRFSCGRDKTTFQVVTMNINITESSPTGVICDVVNLPSYTIKGSDVINPFFEKEQRLFYGLDSMLFITTASYKIDSVRLDYFYFSKTGSQLIHSKTYIPTLEGIGWKLVHPDLLSDVWDESYGIQVAPFASLISCSQTSKDTLPSVNTILFINSKNNFPFYFGTNHNNIINQFAYSKISKLNIINGSNQFKINTNGVISSSKNISTTALLGKTGSSGSLKICFSSKKGEINNFNITTGSKLNVEKINDSCFFIKNINGDSSYVLSITATNQACDGDTIFIKSNWSCSQDLNKIQDSCLSSIQKIPVIPQLPELELDVMQADRVSDLCDTLAKMNIEFYNGDFGVAYDVLMNVSIPSGITILSSSLEYSYPAGSPFKPLSLPQTIGAGLYQWNLSELIAEIKQNGLRGINEAPYNRILIRFNPKTDCSSLVNSFIQVSVSGKSLCDQPTNSIIRSGKQIQIKNLELNGNVNIEASVQNTGCSDLALVKLKVITDQSFSNLDTLRISLPSSIDYFNSSYKSNSGLSSSISRIEKTSNQTVLIIASLPSVNKILDAEFSVFGVNRSQCSTNPIQISLDQLKSAFCKETNQFCQVRLERSSYSLNFNIKRATAKINSIENNEQCGADQVGLTVNYTINNVSNSFDSTFQLKLYSDQNQNQRLDPNDQLLELKQIPFPQGRDSASLTSSFCIDKKSLASCKVFALLSSSCFCKADTQIYLTGLDSLYIRDSICSGTSLKLGVNSVAGRQYRWYGDGLLCDSCSSWIFNSTRQGSKDSVFNFRLEELIDSSCSQIYFYEILVYAIPVGKKEIINICKNKSIVLDAGSRISPQWSGPMISNPSSKTQTIIAIENTEYYLSYLDVHSCPVTDTFCIRLYSDWPNLTISHDTTILLGSSVNLMVTEGFHYKWSPSVGLDCDNCSSVKASPSSSTVYCVKIESDQGCDTTLCVKVNVVFPNCDSSSIFIPNAFTPNSDGKNDKLFVRVQNIDRIVFVIYNRWGQKVFESNDASIGWDGSFGGELLAPDVFGYCVEAFCFNGSKITKKGNVTLLK